MKFFGQIYSTAVLCLATALSVTACSAETETVASPQTATAADPAKPRIANYEFDAARGRALFVSENCVLCHSVNGVGGRAAPPLDKATFLSEIDPVEFSARMWRGATQMIKLQELEIGYQITLSAQDLADLAAFAGDPSEQGNLTLDQVPTSMQESFLNEFMWVDEEYEQ